MEKFKKKIFISIAIGGFIYLAFTIYADFDAVISAFKNFNWVWLPLLLLLSLLNFIFRFFKWDYYLKILNINVKKIDSFSIFMSGLIMSVTPGKMGELLKSFLMKQVSGTPISKTAPIIFAERITDFLSLVIIALIGSFAFDYGKIIVIGVSIFFLLLIIVISNKKLALYFITFLEKIKFLHKYMEHIHNAYNSSYKILRPIALLNMILISLAAWFFECLGYYLVLVNFDMNVGLLWASFSYAFATIVGALSMLPGGLGVTEGSLTLLLIQGGFSNEYAVASTFVGRAVTLWFAVLIGVISVSLYQKRFGKISLESTN